MKKTNYIPPFLAIMIIVIVAFISGACADKIENEKARDTTHVVQATLVATTTVLQAPVVQTVPPVQVALKTTLAMQAALDQRDFATYYELMLSQPEWNEKSQEERREACQIPDDVLSQLTSAQLLEATLACPLLLVNVFLYPTHKDSFESACKDINALALLITKEDVGAVVLDKYELLQQSVTDDVNVNLEQQLKTLEIFLSQKVIKNTLTQAQLEGLDIRDYGGW